VRIFKVSWFTRFASKEGITDDELKAIVNNVLETGQADADLGGNVFKVRVARSGKGKTGGFRIIVFFRKGDKTFYEYGFAKSNRGNISPKELKKFKDLARDTFSITDEEIKRRLENGTLQEIV
jgi:hypothetical protein